MRMRKNIPTNTYMKKRRHIGHEFQNEKDNVNPLKRPVLRLTLVKDYILLSLKY